MCSASRKRILLSAEEVKQRYAHCPHCGAQFKINDWFALFTVPIHDIQVVLH